MNLPFHILAPMLAAAALALSPLAVRAQGIPVIDIANLIQTIQQVINELTQIDNQVQQIEQLDRQVGAITGARNLGSVFDAPALHNYVPASAYQVLEVTSFAVLPNGTQKLMQYLVTPQVFGMTFPGALTLAGNVGTYAGPAGTGAGCPSGCPAPGLSSLSLLGAIGSGSWFEVGALISFSATTAGRCRRTR